MLWRMDNALRTIFYPFTNGRLDWPAADMRTLFLNAQNTLELSHFKQIECHQYFKPYAAALEAAGCAVLSDVPEEGKFDYVLLLLPKNRVEAQYLLAVALKNLKAGGMIISAADNKSGGTRIQKMLHSFDVSDVQEASKNKARVCWAIKENIDQKALSESLSAGARQEIFSGDYLSHPGVFGWDKIDKGSEILLQYLPEKLKGRGADFGCGYGYLGRNILQRYEKIKTLTSIDADYRAVECCRINFEKNAADCELQFLWADLTKPVTALKNLDFIVMNPPFHEGKKTDVEIGKSFISTAHGALRTKGVLYMVANAHLPYEDVLKEKFFNVEKLFEGQGFKIFAAAK